MSDRNIQGCETRSTNPYGNEEDEKSEQNRKRFVKIFICFVCNGCASVTMMIGNKHLSLVFPFPFLTILAQNAIVFLVCAVYNRLFESSSPLRRSHFISCIAVGIATSLVLSTSIVALRFSAVPLIVLQLPFLLLVRLVCPISSCLWMSQKS